MAPDARVRYTATGEQLSGSGFMAMNEAYQNLAAFRVKGKPVYSLVRNNFVAPGQGSIWGIPNRLFVALAAAAGAQTAWVIDSTQDKLFTVDLATGATALVGSRRSRVPAGSSRTTATCAPGIVACKSEA